MSDLTLDIRLDFDADVDPVEADDLTADLRRAVLEEDVSGVDLTYRQEEAEPGSKGGELIVAGSLAVILAPMALQATFSTLQTWLKNRPVRRLKVSIKGDTLEIDSPSKEDISSTVEAFIKRHE